MVRYAAFDILTSSDEEAFRTAADVTRVLPTNYWAVTVRRGWEGFTVLIFGDDEDDSTLDGSVIPRITRLVRPDLYEIPQPEAEKYYPLDFLPWRDTWEGTTDPGI